MIDDDTLDELRRTFTQAFSVGDPEATRKLLIDAGWFDLLEEDEQAAIALAFRLQGRSGVDAGVLDDVLLRRFGLGPDTDRDSAIAYPIAARARDGNAVTHILFPGRAGIERVVWIADAWQDEVELVALDAPLDARPIEGIDPNLRLRGLAGRPSGRSVTPGGSSLATPCGEALAVGRTAIAHQLVAGSLALFELAVEYARSRRQFGAPIGAFQAVKHRLVDVLVATSAADSAILAAATTIDPVDAMVAKALAARAAAVAGRNCLQVFGGIGFTTEHEFHRYFRRSLALDRLLGDGRSIEQRLGAALRTRQLAEPWGVSLEQEPRWQLVGGPRPQHQSVSER